MTQRYIVAHADSLERLTQTVDALLASGWQTVGGIAARWWPENETGEPHVAFYQAMVGAPLVPAILTGHDSALAPGSQDDTGSREL